MIARNAQISLLLVTLLAGCATKPGADALRAAPQQTASSTTKEGRRQSQTPSSVGQESQVARYTTITTQPSEADSNPLAVVARVHFPRQIVRTVGDAVRYLLLRTGYQLAPDETLDSAVTSVFAMRLPESQRALGPYRVDDMLQVLLSQPYRLVVNPKARVVSYELPQEQPRPAAIAAASAPAATPNR